MSQSSALALERYSKSVKQHFLQHRVDDISRVLVCIGLAFLPISTSIGALILVATVMALFGHAFKLHVTKILRTPLALMTGALILLMVLGLFHTSASFHESFHVLKKYSHKLLSFIILMPLFTSSIWRERVENTLLISAVLIGLLDILDYFHVISLAHIFLKSKRVLISAIPWSIYCSIALFISYYRLLSRRRLSIMYLIVTAYYLAYLYLVNPQKTGMLIGLFLMVYVVVNLQLSMVKKILITFLTIAVTFTLIYSSPSIHKRTNEAVNDIQQLHKGNVHTSLGLRLQFAKYSIAIIKKHPFIGSGTGSFRYEYGRTNGPMLSAQEKKLGDPHNSYLHLGVQFGLVGLSLFLVWLAMIYRQGVFMPFKERLLVRGMLFSLVLASFSVSAFYRTRISSLILTLLCIYLADSLNPDKRIS